jgi:site-specific DNA-methyltransferase (adenine-specific)
MTDRVEIGPCTLALGDCLQLLEELQTASVDAVVTDPPYLMGAASTRRGERAQSPIGDWINASHWYKSWLSECFRITKPAAPVWMFGNWRTLPVVEIAAQALARRITSTLVWNKEWIGVGSMNGLRCQYELVFLMGGPEFSIKDRSIGDIWAHKWSSARPNGHPAEKPVTLAKRLVELSCPEGGLVVDPFMGSGTVLEACVMTGRRCLGFDIDPGYFGKSCDRIRSIKPEERPPLFREGVA